MIAPTPAAEREADSGAPPSFDTPSVRRSATALLSKAADLHSRDRVLAELATLLLLFVVGWSTLSEAASLGALALYTALMIAAGCLILVDPFRGAPAFRAAYLLAFAAIAFAVNLLAGAIAGLSGGIWALYILYYLVAGQALLVFSQHTALLVFGAVWLLFVVNLFLSGWWTAASFDVLRGVASLSTGFLFVGVFTRLSRQAREQALEIAGLNHVLRSVNDDLEAARGRLQTFTDQVEEIAAIRERTRMAQELHDTLGHHLTVLNVQLEAALRLFATDPERSRTQLVRAKESAAAALRDVRAAVTTLRPRPLELGSLNAALDRLVTNFSSSTGLPIDLTITGTTRVLPAAQEAVVYRTVQEALTNIQKHARASRASVTLRYGAASTELTVADNGVGSADPSGGMGLTGIRERAESVGGTVSVRTKPGAGLILHLSLPAPLAGDETPAEDSAALAAGTREET